MSVDQLDVFTCRHCNREVEYVRSTNRRRYSCDDCKKAANLDRATRWAKKNRNRSREIKAKWVAENEEAMAAAREGWRDANMERVRGYRRAWKKRHPEVNRSHVKARKIRLKGGKVVPFSPEQLKNRLAFYGGRCWMCGDVANSIDHVKPISKGGAHMLCNLRPACVQCNSSKSDRWPL